MRHRRIGLGIAAGVLALLAFHHHPTAQLHILTHDRADLSPHRVQAALDLGLVAVDVLYTWTGQLSR